MKIIHAISMIICLAASQAMAASPGNPAYKDRSNLPITIKSNELSADNKGKTAIFKGKVVAKQGDITIYADTLTVNYGYEKNDVDKIEANGNVRIVQGNRIGTASNSVYDNKLGKITLTGNPKVTEGAANTISGNTITYYIDEERSEVRSDGQKRVETTIQPRPRKK
jgi:lipopolysaccharide export system protein LptA